MLGALDDAADAGLAGVVGGEGLGIGEKGLDQLQGYYLAPIVEGDRQVTEETEGAQHGEDVDVVVAETHPEADAVGVDVRGQRMQFVVPVQVDGLVANDREVERPLHRVGGVLAPLAVDPRPDLDELAEVDLGVEVGGEVATMASGVDVEDVDGVDGVEVVFGGESAVSVDHAGVEAGAEDRRHAALGTPIPALPLMVRVPGWVLANGVWVLVDGGVDVGGAGFETRLEHRHVEEGGAEVEHDPGAGFADERHRGRHVEGVELAGVQLRRGVAHMTAPLHALDDCLGLGHGPRGDADVAELVVVYRCLVSSDVGDATGADDEEVGVHGDVPSISVGVLTRGCVQSLRKRTRGVSRWCHRAGGQRSTAF